MRLLLGSFWRAVAYCLHPRVIGLSLLPLLLMVAGAFALGYLLWDRAVDAVLAWLQEWALVEFVLGWLDSVGLSALRVVVAPLLVLALATPLIVVLALLLVAWLVTPALAEWVALRRFPDLQRCRGGGLLGSIVWSAWSALLALLLLALSLPLWLIPPLALVLPPLIWGWLTSRVFAYDVLAAHASAQERRELLAQHRLPLLAMGVVVGLLGAAPSVLWVSGAMFIALAPLLVPLAIWIYTLVFAFGSLWFAHYLLQALHAWRLAQARHPLVPEPAGADTAGPGGVEPPARPPRATVIDVQACPIPAPGTSPPPAS
ncbi:EI24 domain-containing protein [Tepidimonas sp.]|uniref:EI24 domain-containing protein n=1 Tax=Tepidimonas sp. TaxID=2002775 RepID=UPI002FE3A7E6